MYSESRIIRSFVFFPCILMLFTGISFCEIDSSIDTLYKRTVHDMSALLDSPQNDASDSIASMVYDTICTMLRINDSLSRIDSIQRQSLVDQLDSIKPNNSKLKKLLENRIDSITHSDSMRMEKHKVVVSSLRENVIGYPVMLANDTLIIIYSKYGSFTAQERASVISKRILDVARVVGFNTDAFSVFRNETSHDIMYSDKILMSITDNDAFFLESTPDALAQQYLSTIKDSISSYRKNRSFISYTIQIGMIIGILVIVFIGIFLIKRTFHFARNNIEKHRDKYLKGISIKNVSLVSKEIEYKTTFQLLRLVEIAAYIIIGYIALPFLFNVFPATKKISSIITDWTLTPIRSIFLSVFDYLPNVFNITIIIIIFHILLRILKKLFNELEKGTLRFPGFYEDWARPTFSIIRFLVYVLMFVMVFPYLPGSNSPIFKGVSVFLGLLFSLGSTSAIANIIAGLVITYMRPFKIGDRIKIGEVTGDVLEKNMLVTRLRTTKNEIITMPNSTILTSHTINFSTIGTEMQLLLHTSVSIGYDVPWRTVHKLLIDSAKLTDGISTDVEPFVLQKSLDDFYVLYELNAYTSQPHRMVSIYSLLHQNIQDRFNDAKVEILSPHYRTIRNENREKHPSIITEEDNKEKKCAEQGENG